MPPQSQLASNKRVGIWIRVSTEDQAQGESPEHHEKRARYYAEAKGWTIVEVYHLEGVSGKAVTEHPETKRMMADVKSGHITGLLFSKLARLARSTRDLLDFSEFFQQYSADLISLQESIDTSTPAGRLFYTVVAAMAQWEREEIASRVAASVPIRAKLGKPLGGAAPFGYRWENSRLVPDPQEAPVRRLMYELFDQHRRLKTVARILNDAGHRTRNGSHFSDTTIHRLLSDPIAKGIRRANYTRSRGDRKAWEVKPESDWVLTEVDAIVSEELWERCNAELDSRRQSKRGRPSKRPVHLFAGVVFCGCGTKMIVPSNSPKYTCPACRRKIPAIDLEEVYATQLHGFVSSPEEVAAHLENADHELQQQIALLSSITEERDRVQKESDKLYRLYFDDRISGEGFASRNRPLELRLAQLDDQIPDLQGAVDFLRIQLRSAGTIVEEAQTLYGRWPELTQDNKRQIVETITERITIEKDEIHIDLRYLQAPLEEAVEGQRNFRDSWRPPA